MVGVGRCSASGCGNRAHKRYCIECGGRPREELEEESGGSGEGLVSRVVGMV